MAIPVGRNPQVTSKFGISARGDNGQGPLRQPKQTYKFRVLFFNFGAGGNTAEPLTLNANTVDRPSWSWAETEVHSYNSISYFAGKVSYQPINLVVRDTVDNTVLRECGRQIQRQFDAYNSTTFQSAESYKFTMQIQTLQGGHDGYLDTYTLEGCFLTNFQPSGGDYADVNGMMTISMQIRFDACIIEDNTATQNSILADPGQDPLGTLL